jgi:hypothetical protein
MRPVIHPGFGHSGTTSLQRRLFSRRSDVLYCGDPYGNLGGVFSWIKYQDDSNYDRFAVRALCDEHIFSKLGQDRRIIVSDETLIEQPEVYYTPAAMPGATIADRLAEIFPHSIVLFTIRNQFDYVTSTYLNLKKNYARINHRPIEDFSAWFDGQFTQVRNLFLRNLNYSHSILTYAARFGRDAIRVLPLEMIAREGADAYLTRLGEALDLAISDEDRRAFQTIANRRPNAIENDILTLWPDASFRNLYETMESKVGKERLAELLSDAPRTVIELTGEQKRRISERASEGNRWIEQEFGLPLGAYGYPV